MSWFDRIKNALFGKASNDEGHAPTADVEDNGEDEASREGGQAKPSV